MMWSPERKIVILNGVAALFLRPALWAARPRVYVVLRRIPLSSSFHSQPLTLLLN